MVNFAPQVSRRRAPQRRPPGSHARRSTGTSGHPSSRSHPYILDPVTRLAQGGTGDVLGGSVLVLLRGDVDVLDREPLGIDHLDDLLTEVLWGETTTGGER